VIDRNGNVLAGEGFTVSRTGVGAYTISFTPGRVTGFPIPTVSLIENIDRNGVTPSIQGIGFGAQFLVTFWNTAGNPVDSQFSFVVLGAPGPGAAAATNSTASRDGASEPATISAP